MFSHRITKPSTKIITLIILSIIVFRYFDTVQLHTFNPDEHDFVERSYLFDLLFIKHDINNEIWQSDTAYDQPLLAPFIYAVALHVSGINDIRGVQNQVGINADTGIFEKREPWWIRFRFFRPKDIPWEHQGAINMILVSRLAAVIFSVGTIVLIYLIGCKTVSPFVGLVSMVLLATNRLMLITGRRAMADSILLFLILSIVALLTYLIQSILSGRIMKSYLLFIIIGFITGLAASAKLNGWMIVFITILSVIIFVCIKIYRDKDKSKRDYLFIIGGVILHLIVSYGVFLVLNPFLYKQPLKNTLFMFSHRIEESVRQKNYQPENALYTIGDKVKHVFSRTLVYGYKNSFYGYNEKNYNNFDIFGIDALLFIWGLFELFRQIIRRWQTKIDISVQTITLVWITLSFMCLILYLPLDWDRYYLPVIPCVAVCEAIAIADLAGRVLKIVKRWGWFNASGFFYFSD